MGRRGPLPAKRPRIGSDDEPLAAPDHLDEREAAIYNATTAELVDRDLYRRCDGPLIEGYAVLLARSRQIRDAWIAEGQPLLATGARGTNRAPLPFDDAPLRTRRRGLRGTLMLTPTSRARLGAPPAPTDADAAFPELAELRVLPHPAAGLRSPARTRRPRSAT